MLYLTSDHFAVCESASFRFDVPPVVVNAFAFGALVLWYENMVLTAIVLSAVFADIRQSFRLVLLGASAAVAPGDASTLG